MLINIAQMLDARRNKVRLMHNSRLIKGLNERPLPGLRFHNSRGRWRAACGCWPGSGRAQLCPPQQLTGQCLPQLAS